MSCRARSTALDFLMFVELDLISDLASNLMRFLLEHLKGRHPIVLDTAFSSLVGSNRLFPMYSSANERLNNCQIVSTLIEI